MRGMFGKILHQKGEVASDPSEAFKSQIEGHQTSSRNSGIINLPVLGGDGCFGISPYIIVHCLAW